MLFYSINGVQTSHVSVSDRGFAYGDGFFTTAKICDGVIEYQSKHIERLKKASEILEIAPVDFGQLNDEITELALSYSLAVLKIVITAGEGGRGYARSNMLKPTIVISIFEFPLHYNQWINEGISLGIAKTQLGLNPLLQGLKHLNRLEQVILRSELDKLPFDELVVTDINNNVIETTSANIFWQIGKIWYTPILKNSGVKGVLRQQILTLFPEIVETEAPVSDLQKATSIFISNSVMGIVPIHTFNQRKLNNNSQVFMQKLRELM
ncbi:aminodeoxychorismate lyase [Thalassotalea profundi]|uniref:Aminodeoxychorismate lyase n=1 Tax=Thalassotalea profundi TaxID=2036687 RepID=A0ABQ3IQB7_9GAMM|nr:aminodeoxychorismate lyase [Thalassotalea profundi]GHE90667.1 aminodeoxychorismate lyase [Thalassotalea profundi]